MSSSLSSQLRRYSAVGGIGGRVDRGSRSSGPYATHLEDPDLPDAIFACVDLTFSRLLLLRGLLTSFLRRRRSPQEGCARAQAVSQRCRADMVRVFKESDSTITQ